MSKKTVSCHIIQQLLDARATGELEQEKQNAVDRHLRQCQTCRTRAKDLQEMRSLLKQSAPTIPASTNRQLVETINRIASKQRSPYHCAWLKWLAPGAVAGGILATLLVMFRLQAAPGFRLLIASGFLNLIGLALLPAILRENDGFGQ